jgi:hypothetical protein
MAEETQFRENIPADDKKPPRFEDFLKPNPFVRPWMLPYLPSNQRLRDMAVMLAGCAISTGIVAILYEINVNDMVAVGVGGIGVCIFQFDYLNRTTLASMDYGRAKRNVK